MRARVPSLILAGLLATMTCAAQGVYYPPLDSEGWETVAPAALGWDEGALAELVSWLEAEETRAFVVLKDGQIAVEAYFHGFDADSTWVWYSAGKSLMAVMVGLAADEGLLSLDDPTSAYLGPWTLMSRAREDAIKIRHQLTMTTGLNDGGLFSCTLRACLTYRADPGLRWAYHNAPYSLLREVLESAAGVDINAFLATRLSARTGIRGRWEESGFNNFFYSTARSAARFGLLAARGGVWEGDVVLGSDFAAQMIRSSQSMNPSYGYLWWLNGQEAYIAPGDSVRFAGPIAPGAPPDVYTAAGAQGQFVSVSPSLDLVVVRLGGGEAGLVPLAFHDDLWRRLMAVVGAAPTASELPTADREKWAVFPNPASEEVLVHVSHRATLIYVTDALGRRVGQPVTSQFGLNRIEVSGLRPGVYFIVAVTSRGRQVRPVVVN